MSVLQTSMKWADNGCVPKDKTRRLDKDGSHALAPSLTPPWLWLYDGHPLDSFFTMVKLKQLIAIGFLLLQTSIICAQQPVVHASNPQKSISKNTLRAIFSLRLQRWPDGRPVIVLALTNAHPDHDQFCKKKLGIFPYQLQQAWDRLVFSGKAMAPVLVKDQYEMRRIIAHTPGAIGYLSEENLNDRVRILPVE